MKNLIDNGTITRHSEMQNVYYILNDDTLFSVTGYKVLRSQNGNDLIKCAKVIYNGKAKLIYFTEGLTSLQNMLANIDVDTYYKIISNLLNSIISIKNIGFLMCQNIDLSEDKIFVNQNTLEVSLIYLPLSTVSNDASMFENELKSNIIKMITSNIFLNSEKSNRILLYLSNATLSLEELHKKILSECGKNKFQTNDAKEKKQQKIEKKHKRLHFYSLNNSENIDFHISSNEYIIGKNPNKVNGVISFNQAISNVHCKFIYDDDNYYLIDLNSTNGTYVNHYKILPNTPSTINSGDAIRLANSDFVIELEED